MRSGTAALAELFEATPEELRRRALTHSSWVERRTDAYGRLAFLGDSVLGLSIASELFQRFPEADIGELTKVHNQVVSGRSCAQVAEEIGLPDRLRAVAPADGVGLPVEMLTHSERTLASMAESMIGACYLVHGFERTAEAVVEAFEAELEHALSQRFDFKSELQEVLARSGSSVIYEVVKEAGPPHDRRFEVAATVDGDTVGTGSGRSKKEAEQAAAGGALKRLRG